MAIVKPITVKKKDSSTPKRSGAQTGKKQSSQLAVPANKKNSARTSQSTQSNAKKANKTHRSKKTVVVYHKKRSVTQTLKESFSPLSIWGRHFIKKTRDRLAQTSSSVSQTKNLALLTAQQTLTRTKELTQDLASVSSDRFTYFAKVSLQKLQTAKQSMDNKRDAFRASIKKTVSSMRVAGSSVDASSKNKKNKKPTKTPKKAVIVRQESGKQEPFIVQILRNIMYPFWYMFRFHPFITLGSILMSVCILGSAYFVYDLVFRDLPSVDMLTKRTQLLTTRILDRNGQLLYRIYKDENRTLIPLSRIPEHTRQATIAIEDRDFYNHHGFSIKGIVRALKNNWDGEKVQGGSTITQQLVKNTLLSSEKTYKRKARELLLAFIVEERFNKDQILEMYLNEVAYGGSTYGIEEAAQRYFGKSAAQLTLAESAFLAGLPAAPSVYSPFGASPEYAFTRQREVLRRMVEDGYITETQAEEAKNQTLTFKQDTTDIKAPHFVMYVKAMLEQQYGAEVVNQGGLEVRTTLDLNVHNSTQEIVTKEMESLARLRISNGAALVTNPQTGEIIAMVGSKNYFDFANDGQVNVTMRPRQPGSSIKPLTYAIAFEAQNKNPSSTIADEPITFNTPGSPPYSPKNYDGKFHGNVTIRESLGSSYNIPAVKTLASIGISTMIDKAEQMGVTTWQDRRRFGLSLTLGGGEVLMTELSQIYGSFATYGKTVTLNPILEIKNSKGQILYQNTCAIEKKDCPVRQTLSPKVAYQITDILSDNIARAPGFGTRSVLHIPGQQVAVKTGTTNNLRDNWTVGYTQDRVVAVWVGNNDNRPMSYVASGVTGASPIWNKIIRTMLKDDQPHQFPTPEGLIRVKVCARTGTLPCTGCPYVREELFEPGQEPKVACNPAQFRPKPRPVQGTSNPSDPNRDRILDGIFIQQ